MSNLFRSIRHLVWMTVNSLAVILLLVAQMSVLIPPSSPLGLLPAILGIGYEVLVVTNLFFALSWLFTHRKAWCLVSLIAILLTLPALRSTWTLNSTPLLEQERPGEVEQLTSLSLLTYNTHLLQRNTPIDRNDLLRYVKNSGADVVCMQEYAVYKDARYPTFDGVKRFLEDVYPYTYYDFIVHNRRLQFGLAVYSKYPLIHKHSIPFNSPGNSASRCDIVLGPDTFRLFNVHLQSNAFQSSDIDSLLTLSSAPRNEWVDRVKHQPSLAKLRRAYAARTEQVRLLQREMDNSPYPVILCGDFNDVPVSYTYRQLSRHLSDAFRSASPLSPAHTFVRRHLGVRIDYILHSPSLRAASFRVSPLDYSDHYPVATTLYW